MRNKYTVQISVWLWEILEEDGGKSAHMRARDFLAKNLATCLWTLAFARLQISGGNVAVVTVNEQSVHMIVALLCMAFQLGGDSVLRVARSRSILGGPWMVFQLVCNGVLRVARPRSILRGPWLAFQLVCNGVLRVARSRSILGGPWMVFQLVCNGVFRVARSRSILGGPSLFFDYVCHFSW